MRDSQFIGLLELLEGDGQSRFLLGFKFARMLQIDLRWCLWMAEDLSMSLDASTNLGR